MLIQTFFKFGFSALLLLISATSFALDLNLPDRLKTPSTHFSHLEKNAFLALARAGNRIVAVGERGVIALSDDHGVSWKQSNVPVSTLLTAIDFINEQEAWAVGHSGVILHTNDQANTWKLVLDGHQANKLLLIKAQKVLEAAQADYEHAEEYEKEDYQYAMEDAEFALSNAEFDVGLGPSNPFLDVLFLNDKKGFAVGAYGLFVMTLDGGATWESVAGRLENFDRYHLNTLDQLEGGAIIIAGEAGTLFVSYDEGDQWETLYGPYQGSFFGIQPTGKKDEALLYGLKGHVFKTQNAGQNWKRINVDAETSLTSSALSKNGSIVIAGLSGVVMISHDQGNSFELLNTTGFEGFNAVEFSDEKNLVLVSDEGISRLKVQ